MKNYYITLLQRYPAESLNDSWINKKLILRYYKHFQKAMNTAFYEPIEDWKTLPYTTPLQPLMYSIETKKNLSRFRDSQLYKRVCTFEYRMGEENNMKDNEVIFFIGLNMFKPIRNDYVKWRARNGFGLYIYKMGHPNLFLAELSVYYRKSLSEEK